MEALPGGPFPVLIEEILPKSVMPRVETEAFNLLFSQVEDHSIDEAMVEEMYFSMIQRHPFYILNQTAAKNIYGEPTGEPSYTTLSPPIPIHVKLDPGEEDLSRYGYDNTRHAIVSFSAKILRDRSLVPKVGDRIDFIYSNNNGQTVIEHLILTQCSQTDFQRQTRNPYHVTAAADRTEKAMRP